MTGVEIAFALVGTGISLGGFLLSTRAQLRDPNRYRALRQALEGFTSHERLHNAAGEPEDRRVQKAIAQLVRLMEVGELIAEQIRSYATIRLRIGGAVLLSVVLVTLIDLPEEIAEHILPNLPQVELPDLYMVLGVGGGGIVASLLDLNGSRDERRLLENLTDLRILFYREFVSKASVAFNQDADKVRKELSSGANEIAAEFIRQLKDKQGSSDEKAQGKISPS